MSICIYTAFRVKPENLTLVLKKYKEILWPYVEDYVFSLLTIHNSVRDPGDDNLKHPVHLLSELWREIKKAADEPQRDPFDPSLSIAITYHGKYCYLRPFQSSSGYTLDDLLKPDKVKIPTYEDYCYFNSTDKPDDISQKKWNQRRNVWLAIDDSFPNAITTVMSIFEADLTFWCRTFGLWGVPFEGTSDKITFPYVPERFRKFFLDLDKEYRKSKKAKSGRQDRQAMVEK